jgi:aspartyl-tRNA(Asn)/glutamyl-tRNA(Gln) amidotransferase subunit C
VYDFAPFFLQFCDTDQTMADTLLDAAQIGAIAQLARLDLRPVEVPVYQDSLSRILSLVGELERADTGGVTPMAHPLSGSVQRLREDHVTERDHHERYQTNAPRVEAGLYLVPKVIE